MNAPFRSTSDSHRAAAPGSCSIQSSVERRLLGSGYAALGRVWCEFQPESGVLHLSGSLPSYYLKQLAQELVIDLEGVRLVINQITVARAREGREVVTRNETPANSIPAPKLASQQSQREDSTMATATWIKSMLEKRGVAFEERHHRPAFTAQEVAQSEHVSGHQLAKVVVVMADGLPVELILPASRRVAMERVRNLLEADKVFLASEAEMEQIVDHMPSR